MSTVVIAPMLVVLVTAVLTLLFGRHPRLRTALAITGTAGYAVAVAALAWTVVLAPDAPGIATYQVGGHPAPFGITLVADGLSAFMLAMVATVGLASAAFSTRYVRTIGYERRTFYNPLFHVLLLGVTGAFLTGDLFNLFVWFEVMLMASYVFVAYYGGPSHTRAAFRYVALNLVASAVFLLAVGGIYATTGTLNMADLAERLADPAAHGIDTGPMVGLFGLLLSVFALKAGLVPFQFWIPSAYRAAPPPVTALLAGATKKVGIYAIIRLSFTVFDGADVPLSVSLPGTDLGIAGASPLVFVGPVLFAMAAASILIGGLGAIGRPSVEGVFAYSSIGQVGFIALPIALAASTTSEEFRRLAVLAALIYALNHALAKGLLFLSAGAVRSATGTTSLESLGGLARRAPVLSIAVFVGALALVGMPPLSGFFGKFLVFETAIRAEAAGALAVLLGGSLLTVVYATRVWNRGFWGSPSQAVVDARLDPIQVAAVAALAAGVLAIGLGFEPVHGFAEAAAEAALDTEGYVEAVDPVNGGEGA